MARPKPETSDRLDNLRWVTENEDSTDNLDNVELGRWRHLMRTQAKWVMQQRRLEEKDYKEELAAWRKEVEEEKKAGKEKKASVEVDVGMGRSLELLNKLIVEITPK